MVVATPAAIGLGTSATFFAHNQVCNPLALEGRSVIWIRIKIVGVVLGEVAGVGTNFTQPAASESLAVHVDLTTDNVERSAYIENDNPSR